jgi:hypothetical protein
MTAFSTLKGVVDQKATILTLLDVCRPISLAQAPVACHA